VTTQVTHLEEQWAEHLGDGEYPLGVADVLLDVVDQEGAELGATLGGAGGAEAALLAREGDEHLVATGVTADAGEAVVPDSAVEVAGDGLVPETAEEPVAGLKALLPVQLDGLVKSFEESEQRSLPRIARAVDGRHAGQAGRGPCRSRRTALSREALRRSLLSAACMCAVSSASIVNPT